MSTTGGTGAVWRHLGFAVALAASAMLGRSTTLEGTGFALIWPAAGIGALWYLWAARGRAGRYWALAGIAAVSGSLNYLTGLPPQRAALFGLALAVQAAVVHLLMTRVQAGRDTGVRSFFVTLSASVAAAAVGAGMVTAALVLVGGADPLVAFSAWLIRNGIGMSMLVSFGLLLAPGSFLPATEGTPGDARRDFLQWHAPVRSRSSRVLEALALTLSTAVACLVGYVLNAGLPLFFITLPFGFWAAMRFRSPWAYAHAFTVGGLLLTVTLFGGGPFSGLAPATAAYVAQLYAFASFVVTALLALHRDETTRLLAELQRAGEEAQQSAQLRDVVLSGMSEGILVADESGEYMLQNDVARKMLAALDTDPDDGSGYAQVYAATGERLTREQFPMARALRGETVLGYEVSLHLGGRDLRRLRVDAFPLELPRGDRPGAVAVVRDVTDDNRQREQLNRFASVVAHDLKTPLTVFDGWLELLEEEGGNESARTRAVASMQSASTKMNRLIKDLLAYSSAKDGQQDPTVIDVGALAYAVGEPLVALAERRGSGTVELDITAEDLVYADRKRMEQVLANLLGNAVKYADARRPLRITVSSRPDDDGAWVVVEVADNGIGIPEAELGDIFTEFRRASNGWSRAEGNGLGLAICRRIVEAHGGTISARRGDGHGTVFAFTLPAEPDGDDAA